MVYCGASWSAGDTEMVGSELRRKRYAMPDYVRDALIRNSLMQAYKVRPSYQQNDYVGWITRAARDATRRRRVAQMLEELARGDRYMKMPYKPSKPKKRVPRGNAQSQ
jgi:uncharacterized protein YdeI (YjbR/CyaY-like superfamily)